MQKNWIGKSVGCEIRFEVEGQNKKINVFTTRPDTIFGASFLAVSVDHPISKYFLDDPEIAQHTQSIIQYCRSNKNQRTKLDAFMEEYGL